MSHHWLIFAFSCFGTVRLQYISTGGSGADSVLNTQESVLNYPLPYINYFNQASPRNEFETLQGDGSANDPDNQFYQDNQQPPDLERKRRTTDEKVRDKRWLPNLVDTDETMYIQSDKVDGSPFFLRLSGALEDNVTDLSEPMEKKSFSPWGGKRDKASFEHLWSWKRSAGIREPSMPKRVRFSPWGGKRSGPVIIKPGVKGSKVIFSTSVPELTRVVTNYSPNNERFNLAGFQFIPTLDKRHPIKLLALSTKVDDRTLRDALPFNTFMETLPRIFKPGHTYTDVHLKKDGKRKVKFSAWGGKRSPPIIGPIWSAAPQGFKDSALNTLLLIRSKQDKDEQTKMAH